MNWNNILFFKPSEFACRCGECGSDGLEMDVQFVYALHQLRSRYGKPLIITSGYRCPEYNSRISSTGEAGPHTTGRAADISIRGREAFELLRHVMRDGYMTGVGINQRGDFSQRFIHLDNLEHEGRPRVWTY